MTTKTDITLPPLPRYMDSVTAEEFDRRVLAWGRAAVEADRQRRGEPSSLAEVWRINADEAEAYGQSDRADILRECAAEVERLAAPQPAEPVKVQSDAELEKAWDRFEAEMARQPTDFDLEEFMAQFADEQGNIADDRHAEAARAVLSRYSSGQPVAWMTADGRVATDDTKRNSMSSPSREAFCIPLGVINTVEPKLDTPAASAEPVYAFRRKGQDEFVTCGPERFAELQAKPHLFETRIFYAAPVAQEPAAYGVLAANTGMMFRLELAEDYEDAGLAEMRPEHVVPLYAAPVAAQVQAVVNKQLTTELSAQDREDAERYRCIVNEWFNDNDCGCDFQLVNVPPPEAYKSKCDIDAAIDAVRAAKGADHA